MNKGLIVTFLIFTTTIKAQFVQMVDYRGDSKLDTTISIDESSIRYGVINFLKSNHEYHLSDAATELGIFKFSYSFTGTSTWGASKRKLYKYTEPMCSPCINGYGKNAFVEITVTTTPKQGKTKLDCSFRFLSHGEATGYGGEGPFPMNSKYVWESEFLKAFTYSISEAEIPNNEPLASSGTCFALNENGYLVTNYHVIENAKNIKIRGINSEFDIAYSAKIIASDNHNDLAILKIEDERFSHLNNLPYKLIFEMADVGESVYTLGYPLRSSMGDEIKLTNGLISSGSGFQGDITSYQVSTPIQPGNSGGPLLNSHGEIIGIVNARHRGAENASYAIKAIYLDLLIKASSANIKLSNTSELQEFNLVDQVKLVREFVYIVEVNQEN